MSQLLPVYDVIVVGAGHAGCEDKPCSYMKRLPMEI